MTKNDFYNSMAAITDLRLKFQKFYIMRVWARIGETEVTTSFENVTSEEVYELYRSVFQTLQNEIMAGTARIFLDPQFFGPRK